MLVSPEHEKRTLSQAQQETQALLPGVREKADNNPPPGHNNDKRFQHYSGKEKSMPDPDVSLETTAGPLQLKNPFLLASGPPTASGEQIRHAFRLGWAGAVTKTITPETMKISDVSPRFAAWKDEKSGLLGFENIELLSKKDLAYWVREIGEIRREYPDRVLIASIMASPDPAEWQELAGTMQDAGADAIELNVSCPHGTPERGVGAAMGQHPDLVAGVTRAVRRVAKVPLIVKLTPNVTDILAVAQAAVDNGADILAAINTVQCLMGIDLDTLEPRPSVAGSGTYGGYSGPAVKPIGLRVVSQIARESDVPLMGIGGISRWQDAAEYIAAGASAVQVCTAVMWEGAGIIRDMNAGLAGYLAEKHFNGPGALRGRALSRIGTHESLSRDVKWYATVGFPEQCTTCGRCVVACRDGGYNAITVDDRHVVIDAGRCDGCSLCSLVCPESVIVMQRL
jgi:dihydropyrimidine dehydrogenase (NAD+) subunit PreA